MVAANGQPAGQHPENCTPAVVTGPRAVDSHGFAKFSPNAQRCIRRRVHPHGFAIGHGRRLASGDVSGIPLYVGRIVCQRFQDVDLVLLQLGDKFGRQPVFRSKPYETSPRENPIGPRSGKVNVVRGGSFRDNLDYCLSGRRHSHETNFIYYNLGFRCVRNLVLEMPKQGVTPSPAVVPFNAK